MSESEEFPKRLRRNGKQQSCEPCRLRKQSCSHQTPCARCVRHSRNCVYVHAPMSRLSKSDSTLRSTSPRGTTPSNASTSIARYTTAPRKPVSHENPLTFVTGGDLGYKRTPGTLSFSYVGSTGYSAIFDEAKGHLGMNIWEDTDGSDPNPTIPFLRTRSDGSRPGIDFCQKILAWLPSREITEKIIDWSSKESVICSQKWSTVLMWHTSLWETYESHLREPRNETRLSGMIETIVKSTARPLPRRPTTNRIWQESYSGCNSRWEMFGELFLTIGTAVLTMPESEPLLREILPPDLREKKKSFACSMLECADACLLLCEELDGSSNIHSVGLLARCLILQSQIEGDSSPEVWRRCGRLASAATGQGLHLAMENVEQIAPLYHQSRSEIWFLAYNMVIGLASFTGRPALLSKRYITTPLPLDVSDKALLEAENVLELQKTTNSNGWSIEGGLYPATRNRTFLIAAMERDDILDLTLTQSLGNMNERIRNRVSSAREKSWWDGLSYLKFSPTRFTVVVDQGDIKTASHPKLSPLDLRGRIEAGRMQLPPFSQLPIDKRFFVEKSVKEISFMAQTRLTFLHSDFLVERLEHEGKDDQKLLRIAKEMLNLTVTYWNERDRFPSHREEVHWFISSAGIPAASALAIDLLKQATSPYPKTSSPQRPETIQDLSLFVACLDWIRPEDGNYVLCGRVRKMIKHILDRVLAPNVPTTQEQGFSNYNLNDISINDLPQFGMEYGGWLDGIDAAGMGLEWSNGILQY